MAEMVERVALAIATARAGSENAAESQFKAGNLWCDSMREARAAIEAMREPTEAMVHAVEDDCTAWECFRENGDKWEPSDAYRSMIAAALNTSEG